MKRPSANTFCEECGISIDLHAGDDSCDLAEQKARLMSMFWGAFS